jgi:hypothetical protein
MVDINKFRAEVIAEISRLKHILNALDGAGIGVPGIPVNPEPSGTPRTDSQIPVGTVLGLDATGTTVVTARKRTQPQSAKDAISRYQKARHERLRREKAERAANESNVPGVAVERRL